MISLLRAITIVGCIIAFPPIASAEESHESKVAFVCKLAPKGESPATIKGWNFGFLLDGAPKSPAVPPVDVSETIDKEGLLGGAKIVRFHDNGNGYLAGVTGSLKDAKTLMLSLSKSTKGPWHDAGIGALSGDHDPIYLGACFGLKTKDTSVDFHKAMAEHEEKQ